MSKSPYDGFTVPVLLDFTLKDLPAVLRLSFRSGERPILVSPRAPAWKPVLRAGCAFRIPADGAGEIRDEILTELLLNLPVSYTETRVRLVPFSPRAQAYVHRNRTVLSALFLLADPETAQSPGKEASA